MAGLVPACQASSCRHHRACPGDPRSWHEKSRTWMPGTSPGMTERACPATSSARTRFALSPGMTERVRTWTLGTSARSKASSPCPGMTNRLAGKSVILCPPPFAKIFAFLSKANHFISHAVSSHQRGVSRSSRTRDGMRWTRLVLLTNGADADGEVVWS